MGWLRRAAVLIALMTSLGYDGVEARRTDELSALREQVSHLYGDGRYAEAIPIAERYVALARRKRGEKHTEFATAIEWLGNLYRSVGRYAEAEPLLKRSLAIREKTMGPGHRNVGQSLNSLAELYWAQGRATEVEPLVKRSLTIREKALGPDHRDVGQSLNNLGTLYLSQGRHDDAEPLLKRSLAIREKALGPDHPDVAESLNNVAAIYENTGRYAEAEPLYKRSLAIYEKARGPDHPDVATSLKKLAEFYWVQGRYPEAEPLLKRSLAITEKALGPDHQSIGSILNSLGLLFKDQGRYGEAEPLLKRSLAIREKTLDPKHPDVARALNNLAALYRALGRYAEAEPLYKRSLAIRENALGPEHPDVAAALNNLASLYQDQGRFGEVEPLYQRAVSILEKVPGSGHRGLSPTLNNLASLYEDQGRYSEAESLFKRSLAIREKLLGPEHPDVGTALNNLALLYQRQGRYGEAESLFKRSLTIREKALGPEHSDVANALNNLAGLYDLQGNFSEAEPLLQRSLAIIEKAQGADHPSASEVLNNLAVLYMKQGRFHEAEPLLKRSLVIREKARGPDHTDVAHALTNLGDLYRLEGRVGESESLFKRGLAILEKALGPNHTDVAHALNSQGELYRVQGRYTEAEPLYKRALAIREKALDPDHRDVGESLNDLALVYLGQRRYAEAEPLFKRGLLISEKALGPDHPDVATALNNMAAVYIARLDWARAADQWRRSTDIIIRRGAITNGKTQTGKGRNEAQVLSHHFFGLVKVVYHIALKEPNKATGEAREMFETAQWALASEAAAALAQMAARGAKGDPVLATLVRERQDLVVEWQSRDGARTTAVSQPVAKRNRTAEAINVARLEAIDKRIGEIDQRFRVEFPDYAALASPAPLPATDVQALLGPDEALVLFLDTDSRYRPIPEETYVWVVTKTEVRWVRSDLGTTALQREVSALRCGLDATSWDYDGGAKCANLLKLSMDKVPRGNAPLPFDHARAHALYKMLFGEVEDLIKGKHLLLVPSGALTQLPFQVLVTAPPAGNDNREVAWLVREHALTVLPAVSSLKALRQVARPSTATRPMIGFGNPLLDGNQQDPVYGAYFKEDAVLAREQQGCAETTALRTASLRGFPRNLTPMAQQGSHVDVAQVRSQAPLPETAEELCTVARTLKADIGEIRLGARATEREVKALSASGALAQYRIVHFATHGALAGQLSATSEPGLILTPPAEATEEDDGYLSASEIAGLKLDADWVILSACNTAGGAGPLGSRQVTAGAEALGGLARAFFYAQARALLVSHWAVDSKATVTLITSAVGAMSSEKGVGRAEALRRAMLAMIDKGEPYEAHPAYWAPFVVVGEGAANAEAVPQSAAWLKKQEDDRKRAEGVPAPGEIFRDCPTCPELVVIPAGSFIMGSPESEAGYSSGEGPQRQVIIARPFAAGKFEVTFDEWDACVADGGCRGYRPADQGWGRGRLPVINVSWFDAKEYLWWLSQKTGYPYRLLSEAEWEYAARAGTTTPYSTGQDITTNDANFNDGSEQWQHRQRTVEVGSFKPNPYGLHDMHGNVYEWVEDCAPSSYTSAPTDGSAWSNAICSAHHLRGGSWVSNPKSLRSADRTRDKGVSRSNLIGFRVGKTL
jgi:formylglycine-generating enzyme required for sulfatase activity/tetratricopeptide (TPR) repeat protein/CHAT domain-containing protein